MTSTAKDPPYLMGRTDEETARLQRQAQIYDPLTRRLLVDAGIGPGMRVLDIGSGAGDVALLVAKLVGPTGEVIGVDTNPDILNVARSRVENAGLANVTFRAGDARGVTLTGRFDAVVGRFVLAWMHDHVMLLRACAAHLKPRGVVIFQEVDLYTGYLAVPESRIVQGWMDWIRCLARDSGIDPAYAFQLYSAFCEAGLSDPEMRYEAPIGGGPTWIGYETLTDHARTWRGLLIEKGIATDAEMQVATLAERLRDEVVQQQGVLRCLPAIGIWGRLSEHPNQVSPRLARLQA